MVPVKKIVAVIIILFFVPSIICNWFGYASGSSIGPACASFGGSNFAVKYLGTAAGFGAIFLAVLELI